MKKLRIILLIAVVLLVGLPPVFGLLTERAVHARAESLTEEGRLLVTVEGLDRGWFSSRARLAIAPGPAADPSRIALLGLAEPMIVLVDFQHGPVALRDGPFVGFSKMFARPAPSEAGGVSAPFDFEFRAQSTFGGTVNFVGDVAAFESDAEDRALRFSGGRLRGTVEQERTQAWFDAETLRYRQGPATFTLVGLHASADDRNSRDEMPDVLTLRVDRMSMDLGAEGQSTVFDLSALDVQASTAPDDAGEALSGTLHGGIERLVLGETEINGVRLETAAERVDIAALQAYMGAARRAAETGTPLPAEAEAAAARLLAGAPVVSIDTLRFEMNGEPFEASVQAAADSAALPPSGAVDLRDPALWTAVLDGSAEIVIAKTLAERLAIEIAKSQIGSSVGQGGSMSDRSIEALAAARAGIVLALLATQGFIEETGNLYRTDLRLENGQLTINGRPLPFELP